MILRTLIIIGLSLLSISSFSQAPSRKEFNETVKELKEVKKSLEHYQSKIKATEREDSILRFKLDSLSKYVEDGRLRKSLDSAESTINSFDTFYSTVSILLGFFALVFTVIPGFYWYFQIRPNVEQIRNLNNDFENRFEGAIKKYQQVTRSEKIDLAVSNIVRNNGDQGLYSIYYLALAPTELISDNHLFNLFRALNQISNSDARKALLQILLRRESEYANDYIKKQFDSTSYDLSIDNYCLVYLAENNLIENHLPSLSIRLINSPNKVELFKNYANWLSGESHTLKELVHIINYEPLISKLELEAIAEMNLELKNEWYNEIHKEIESSLLKKSIQLPLLSKRLISDSNKAELFRNYANWLSQKSQTLAELVKIINYQPLISELELEAIAEMNHELENERYNSIRNEIESSMLKKSAQSL